MICPGDRRPAAAIESADGDILVHCRSGRAWIMWQAYLVERRGYSLAEAAAVAKTIGERPVSPERLLIARSGRGPAGRSVVAEVGPLWGRRLPRGGPVGGQEAATLGPMVHPGTM